MWGFQIPWQDAKGGTLYLLFIKKSLPIFFFFLQRDYVLWGNLENRDKRKEEKNSP